MYAPVEIGVEMDVPPVEECPSLEAVREVFGAGEPVTVPPERARWPVARGGVAAGGRATDETRSVAGQWCPSQSSRASSMASTVCSSWSRSMDSGGWNRRTLE